MPIYFAAALASVILQSGFAIPLKQSDQILLNLAQSAASLGAL